MNRFILSLAIVVATFSSIQAQQEFQFTQYFDNTLLINPAIAGNKDALSVTALVRQQWTGLAGAPTTQTLTVHTPLPNQNIALGVSVMHDKVGPLKEIGLFGDFAYRLLLSEKSRLTLGVKVGFDNFNNDLTRLDLIENTDASFFRDIDGAIKVNVGFGLNFQHEHFYVAASVPRFIKNEFDKDNQHIKTDRDKQRQHMYLSAGGQYIVNKMFSLKPSIFVKAVQGAPVTIDLTAGFGLFQKMYIAAAYRTSDAVSGILQYEFMEGLKLGYAYDYTLTDLTEYNSGTHEILLDYRLNYRARKVKSPRYF